MLFVGVVAPRAEAPTQLPSCHRLGPGDVSFEAKRFRHRAIAPHQLPVGNVAVAAGPG